MVVRELSAISHPARQVATSESGPNPVRSVSRPLSFRVAERKGLEAGEADGHPLGKPRRVHPSASWAAERFFILTLDIWPAPGSEDTELRCLMEQEAAADRQKPECHHAFEPESSSR